MMLIVFVWTALTLLFIHRLLIILRYNIPQMIKLKEIDLSFNLKTLFGEKRIVGPKLLLPEGINPRPAFQLGIWSVELWLLILFYSAFGTSITAHLTAAITAFGVMFLLREKHVPLMEGLQLIPMNMETYNDNIRTTQESVA